MKIKKTIFEAFGAKEKGMRMQSAVLGVGAALALAPVAMASDAGSSGVSGMPAVLGAFETVTSLMNSVWTLMTSNPLLTLFLAAGLLSIGVRAFRQIKRAAKG